MKKAVLEEFAPVCDGGKESADTWSKKTLKDCKKTERQREAAHTHEAVYYNLNPFQELYKSNTYKRDNAKHF